jgi:nucleotide-binding universal stress UspA family protein
VYRNILLATDGSTLSGRAEAHAIALAGSMSARLTVVYVSPELPSPATADGVIYEPVSKREHAAMCKAAGEKIVRRALDRAAAAKITAAGVQIMAASPWEGILAAARRNKCDAIVMASHGRRGLAAMLLGSETQKVLTHSRLPVLVVR